MNLRYLVILFLGAQAFASNCIYIGDNALLRLTEDGAFIFYQQEMSLKMNIAGDYLYRNDSLILSTHHMGIESAVLAIYSIDAIEGNLLYAQKEYLSFVPQKLRLLKELFENSRPKVEYIWEDKEGHAYSKYTYNDRGGILSIKHFEQGLLDGKQVQFFDNLYGAIQEEEHYKNGIAHGKKYYFEPTDNTFLKMALVKEEKYKKGSLVHTKKPATPPIFYTSHF